MIQAVQSTASHLSPFRLVTVSGLSAQPPLYSTHRPLAPSSPRPQLPQPSALLRRTSNPRRDLITPSRNDPSVVLLAIMQRIKIDSRGLDVIREEFSFASAAYIIGAAVGSVGDEDTRVCRGGHGAERSGKEEVVEGLHPFVCRNVTICA